MVLGAVARRWSERPDEHLLPFLLRIVDVRSDVQPDHLSEVGDEELAASLDRAWGDDARTSPPTARARPGHVQVLAVTADRWRELPDMRLGQLLVNAVREHRPDAIPHPLFALADGALLGRLGPLTEEERRYVAVELAAARRGWREWSRRQGPA